MDALLIVERHVGRIRYPIKVDRWNLHAEQEDETILCLDIETDVPIRELGETPRAEYRNDDDRPSWFVKLIRHGLRMAYLTPGTVSLLPKGYDESRRDNKNTIYFNPVNQETDENIISILAVEGDRLRIRMEVLTLYETFHGGSLVQASLDLAKSRVNVTLADVLSSTLTFLGV